MDRTTKTKIILFACIGVFVLIVVAVCIAFSGNKSGSQEDSVNTSLRAQEQSDFTLDDMLKSENEQLHPDYESFTSGGQGQQRPSDQDPEVMALQEQLRQNQDQATDSVPVQKRTVTKKKKAPVPEAEPHQNRSRFFSSSDEENTGNTVEVIVSGDQKITDGSVLKMVTLQEIQLQNGLILSKGTAIYGVVKLAQDRINIQIQSVRVNNSIYDLKKQVFDRDGLPGVYVPLNVKAEAGKEAAGEVVGGLNVSTYGTDILSTGVNAVTNAAKSVFRKKNNQIIVTVKSNYKLYLK